MTNKSLFAKTLKDANNDPEKRRWIYAPYDQLSAGIGPLAAEDPRDIGLVLIENRWKAARRPYHKQKLALILANMRHFAIEQAKRGVAVHYINANSGSYATALAPFAEQVGPIRVMRPAERELRVDLEPIVDAGLLEWMPHEGWLTTQEQFLDSTKGGKPPYRMDSFYRHVRRQSGILMDADNPDDPVGGKFSFDSENRKPWKGTPPATKPPEFPRDPIKEEVAELIENLFTHHPGRLDLSALPATEDDAATAWNWAIEHALPNFGPFEDAMSTESTTLFHTRISALLNIHRLLPANVLTEVQAADIPLASKEGFVRQILGWREFVRHIHEQTDGFRTQPDQSDSTPATNSVPGDAGYSKWAGEEWPSQPGPDDPDGGATPRYFERSIPLPVAFWKANSGMNCLDQVVQSVWDEGYSHHITRLMILSNIATLLDVEPRELTDWFWVAYTDAYDWVVEPNVLGMGTYAVGPIMTTKPYVAGAAYINRMSDYCQNCSFDPKRNCPVTNLYWAFLDRHQSQVSDCPRLNMPLASLRKRSDARKKHDAAVYDTLVAALTEGQTLSPKAIPDPPGRKTQKTGNKKK